MKTFSSYPGAYERFYLIYPISCLDARFLCSRAAARSSARATIGYLVYKFRVRLGITVICKIPLFDRALGLKAKQNNRYAKRALVGGYLVCIQA